MWCKHLCEKIQPKLGSLYYRDNVIAGNSLVFNFDPKVVRGYGGLPGLPVEPGGLW